MYTLGKYRKVIVTNHVIEVYEYEKSPTVSEIKKNDDYDALDLWNTNLKRDVDRVKERRQQTVRDARNVTKRLAIKNFTSGDKFLTLTFDPKKFTEKELRDVSFTDDLFKKFIKRFNYRFKIKLRYIAVREFHKSGRIHYHMLCDWKKELVFEDEIRENESMLGEGVWKHGFVDIKQIDLVDNVGAYIIKYMTKNVAIEFFRGKKVYLCSQGLERPFVYTGDSADLIIKEYDLDIKKEVFTNSYESEYLGLITYKEYNLKRN